MKVHRFTRIGDKHTVNIDLITHIWSLRGPHGVNEMKINSVGGVHLGLYADDRTTEYEDAKKLRDQLVGGWHDHQFAQLGPRLSVNPAQITGFRICEDYICMIFANDYTLRLNEGDSGHDELVKLHNNLILGENE